MADHRTPLHFHMPHMSDECDCHGHGHCIDIPIETIAHIYGFANTLLSSAELLCYTVLVSALHVIVERQKETDKDVCDMSLKTFDDPDDDCELKASKVAAALLAISVFEVLLAFLALRGAYRQTNVYFCYIYFIFTSLLVILFPLLQSLFFVVTNWWNSVSYGIMSISILHSLVKLYGMFIIIKFVKWVRKKHDIQQHPDHLSSTPHKATTTTTENDYATLTVSPSGQQHDEDRDDVRPHSDIRSPDPPHPEHVLSQESPRSKDNSEITSA